MGNPKLQAVSDAEILKKTEPIPAGTKRVSRTTREEFEEPLASEPAGGADDDPELFDPPDPDSDRDDDPDLPPLTPLDRFLASFTDYADAVVYVRRKPDSPGLHIEFKNPWNGPITTFGELPFDESFTDRETIDIAVQKTFGGGYYQLQIRTNGQIVKAWSTLIADPPERRETAPAVALAPAPSSTPFKSFHEQAVEFADTAKALGLGPQRNHAIAPAESGDPIDRLEESFDRVEKWKSRLGLNAPTTVVAGGERSWVADVTQLAAVTGFADGFKEFMTPVGQVLGIIVAKKISDTWAAASEAAVNPGSAPNAAATPAANAKNQNPQQPAQPSQQHPPQVMPLLTKIVEDLERNTDVDASVNATVAMIETVRKASDEMFKNVMVYIDGNILKRSPVEVALWLARGNSPTWDHLLRLTHVTNWINEFQLDLYAALNPEAEQPGDGEEDPETTLDLSQIETPDEDRRPSTVDRQPSSAEKGDNQNGRHDERGTDRNDQPDGRREQPVAAGSTGANGNSGDNLRSSSGAKSKGAKGKG